MSQSLNVRPQKVANVDVNNFVTAVGATHDLKYGFGFRMVDAVSGTLWPGNGILAIERSATDLQAQVFRQGYGGNRADYLDFYVGDTIARNRMTLDLGLRYDQQWGKALAGPDRGQRRLSERRPGRVVRRLRHAVHLEEPVAARRPDLRARRVAQDRRARQLQPLRRPARDRHGRRDEPELDRRIRPPTAGSI